MFGATTLIIAISPLALLLPALSIIQAALSVSSRACSIRQRASAMRSRVTPCSATVRPKAMRVIARWHISSQRTLGQADQAHAVVDAARAQAALGDLEAAALAEQDVGRRHAHVLEVDLHVAVRRVVVAEHAERAQDLDARRVDRHQDHRLLRVARRLRVGLAHEDHDLAARVAGARGPPLASVDDVVVAVALDARFDVGRVGRGHRRLGHREGAADLAGQQRLEPLLLVLGRAVAHQHLHVAGVRRRAVEDLARPGHHAHQLGQRGVLLVEQAGAEFAFGQEQVPQLGGARLGLELLDQRQRRPALAGGRVGLDLLRVAALVRVDVLGHEGADAFAQFLGAGGVAEVHGRVSCGGREGAASACRLSKGPGHVGQGPRGRAGGARLRAGGGAVDDPLGDALRDRRPGGTGCRRGRSSSPPSAHPGRRGRCARSSGARSRAPPGCPAPRGPARRCRGRCRAGCARPCSGS